MPTMFRYAGVLVLLCHIATAQPGEITSHKHVKQRWQTDASFNTPESVIFDDSRNYLYVSNMNGGFQERNGKGYISKLKPDGAILEQRWLTGMDSPKGMAIHHDTLYVTDIDKIRAYALSSGKQVLNVSVPDARFLNDIAVTKQGVLYTSDMYAHRLYRFKNQTVDSVAELTNLNRPNGVYIRQNQVYIGNSNHLVAYNPVDKVTHRLEGETGPIDGLHALSAYRFLTSDWKGRLFLQDFSGDQHQQVTLLDTRKTDQRVADMTFIPQRKMAVVPTFGADRICAYHVAVKQLRKE